MFHRWHSQCNVSIRHRLSKNSKKLDTIMKLGVWDMSWWMHHVPSAPIILATSSHILPIGIVSSYLLFAWLFLVWAVLHGYDMKHTSKLQVLYFNRILKNYRKIRTQLKLHCLDCFLKSILFTLCDKNLEKWTILFPLALFKCGDSSVAICHASALLPSFVILQR